MTDTPVSIALRENRQVIERGARLPHLAAWPALGLIAAHGVAGVQIATPFSLLDQHYAFALGLECQPPDLDDVVKVMTDVTSALRPLLRRVRDEERAHMFQRAVEASLDPVLITEADARLHEPLLPAPDRGLGHASLAHDLARAAARCGQQHDAGTPDVLLRAFAVGNHRKEPLAVAGCNVEADPGAHAPDSHGAPRRGNPFSDSSVRLYPLATSCVYSIASII
jgi:hypothetical protein